MGIINKAALKRTLNRRSTVVAASSALSFAAGGGLSYLVLNRKLEAKYVAIAEGEIADAHRVYNEKLEEALLVNKAGPYSDPQSALAALHPDEDAEAPNPEEVEELREAVQDLGYSDRDDEDKTDYTKYSGVNAKIKGETQVTEEVKIRTVETTVTQNIFDEAEKDLHWDYEVELLQRSEETPYVITSEEFYNSPTNYDQVQLFYYEGDGVLSDASDVQIDDIVQLVGENTLTRFGVASGDPNIVHIRHDQDQVEFEVTRVSGKYGEVVAGFIAGEDGGG